MLFKLYIMFLYVLFQQFINYGADAIKMPQKSCFEVCTCYSNKKTSHEGKSFWDVLFSYNEFTKYHGFLFFSTEVLCFCIIHVQTQHM